MKRSFIFRVTLFEGVYGTGIRGPRGVNMTNDTTWYDKATAHYSEYVSTPIP